MPRISTGRMRWNDVALIAAQSEGDGEIASDGYLFSHGQFRESDYDRYHIALTVQRQYAVAILRIIKNDIFNASRDCDHTKNYNGFGSLCTNGFSIFPQEISSVSVLERDYSKTKQNCLDNLE
jgi:hypothetical protein